ncbi:hypothetical protein BH23GEM2_BH23GEM2_12990 [soil metagenome]
MWPCSVCVRIALICLGLGVVPAAPPASAVPPCRGAMNNPIIASRHGGTRRSRRSERALELVRDQTTFGRPPRREESWRHGAKLVVVLLRRALQGSDQAGDRVQTLPHRQAAARNVYFSRT